MARIVGGIGTSRVPTIGIRAALAVAVMVLTSPPPLLPQNQTPKPEPVEAMLVYANRPLLTHLLYGMQYVLGDLRVDDRPRP